MSVADLSKAAALNEQEVLLGMGWLFKEGKIKGDGKKVSLA
ncbi:winged helix-turn-helix domain-containing protein [Hoylesella marshii]|nr:winged helix-turn-helix domain-containing protein [Hoylesella marshii]